MTQQYLSQCAQAYAQVTNSIEPKKGLSSEVFHME